MISQSDMSAKTSDVLGIGVFICKWCKLDEIGMQRDSLDFDLEDAMKPHDVKAVVILKPNN